MPNVDHKNKNETVEELFSNTKLHYFKSLKMLSCQSCGEKLNNVLSCTDHMRLKHPKGPAEKQPKSESQEEKSAVPKVVYVTKTNDEVSDITESV